jgi:hypothetical protein
MSVPLPANDLGYAQCDLTSINAFYLFCCLEYTLHDYFVNVKEFYFLTALFPWFMQAD